MSIFKRKHKVRIVYKSGVVQDVRCKEFTVRWNQVDGIHTVKWEGCEPHPMYLGVDEIAAIYKLR